MVDDFLMAMAWSWVSCPVTRLQRAFDAALHNALYAQ
jgi:hypothetical protein